MIDARLIQLVETLHFDINDLYFSVDSGKCNNDDVLDALGSLLKYADETLDEI